MRILHIISTLNLESGGPADSIRRIIASYKTMGNSGEAVTLDDPGAPFLRELDFPVHALGPVNTTFAYSPKLLPWLKANRHRYDGVVIHGLWQHTGYAAWKALLGKTPYVVFTHGMLDPYFKHAYPLKHMKKWLYWLAAQYWVLRGAHHVLFTSKAEMELATQSFWLHKWSPIVVPYGASGPMGDPEAYRAAWFAHCPAVKDKPYLLYLSRIHRKKGVDLLIDAFAAVASRAPELQLVIAGPDQTNWRPELEARAAAAGIAERIHWPGMIMGDLKWGAYYGCEAFILPSHQENFGIVVAEALACGKPTLLTDKINIAEDVRSCGGALMEEDTYEGVLALLEGWLAMAPEARRQMGINALECFHSHYDMTENAKTINRIFQDVAASGTYKNKQ